MAQQARVFVDVCWGVWGAVWVAGWLYNLASGPHTRRRTRDWPVVLVAAAVWLLARHAARGVWHAHAWRGPWAVWAGAAVLVAGTAFTLWARVQLGRMWSSAPSVKEGHQLQTTGPYAVTRHPIYTGMLAMAAGTVLLAGRWWAVAGFVCVTGYLAYKMRVEERLMTETFGERYAEYRRRTPQVIPGTRRRRR